MKRKSRRIAAEIPGARAAVLHLQSIWDSIRPLPAARYGSNPARRAHQPGQLPVPEPTIASLAAAALSPEAASGVADILERLTASDEHGASMYFYRSGVERFGEYWRYADLLTTLWAATRLRRVTSYLEVGVRRGKSVSVVGAMSPDCSIYGFDMWLEDYAGAANPGPEFVRQELQAVGHRGEVVLVSGNSRKTLPTYLAANRELWLDLVTIDGDKSLAVAASDMACVLPRLKIGGVVVYDDITARQALRRVWNRFVGNDPHFVAWEYVEGPFAVAAAVRIQ